ncbi:MAG: AbrB/MazE/SpoVT family DNA-binding domain-containing protein, partial [Candidatus Bathyarchaeia archaeon]
HVISLPKVWLKTNNLNKGDYISILPQSNGSLFIYPSNGATQDTPSIQLRGFGLTSKSPSFLSLAI